MPVSLRWWHWRQSCSTGSRRLLLHVGAVGIVAGRAAAHADHLVHGRVRLQAVVTGEAQLGVGLPQLPPLAHRLLARPLLLRGEVAVAAGPVLEDAVAELLGGELLVALRAGRVGVGGGLGADRDRRRLGLALLHLPRLEEEGLVAGVGHVAVEAQRGAPMLCRGELLALVTAVADGRAGVLEERVLQAGVGIVAAHAVAPGHRLVHELLFRSAVAGGTDLRALEHLLVRRAVRGVADRAPALGHRAVHRRVAADAFVTRLTQFGLGLLEPPAHQGDLQGVARARVGRLGVAQHDALAPAGAVGRKVAVVAVAILHLGVLVLLVRDLVVAAATEAIVVGGRHASVGSDHQRARFREPGIGRRGRRGAQRQRQDVKPPAMWPALPSLVSTSHGLRSTSASSGTVLRDRRDFFAAAPSY